MNKKCNKEKELMKQEIDKLWERIVEMQNDIWRLQDEKKMEEC